MVVGEEIPFAVDVRQMIRVHDAFLRRLTGLAVMQFKLLPLRDGLGERVENFQIENRLGARAEGNRLLNVGEVERNVVGQRLLHFFDRAQQRFLEARAAILLQGLFRDDEREDFALGDLHRWKRADFAGVVIAIAAGGGFYLADASWPETERKKKDEIAVK